MTHKHNFGLISTRNIKQLSDTKVISMAEQRGQLPDGEEAGVMGRREVAGVTWRREEVVLVSGHIAMKRNAIHLNAPMYFHATILEEIYPPLSYHSPLPDVGRFHVP